MPGSEFLRRALQMARRAKRAASGLPPPRPFSSPGIARRHVLRMLGAGAATVACPPVMAAPHVRRVAIVGGGLAGLNALRVLTEAGIDARLYEARNRLGGRVLTVRDSLVPGVWVDMGGQLVNSDHQDIISLARTFGIKLIDRKALGGAEQIVCDEHVIDPAQFTHELAPIASQIARDSAALDTEKAAAIARLDRLSVADYLERHSSLIRSDQIRTLLIQTIRTEFGVEPHEASAIELILNLPTVHGEAFETLGASDERFVIEDGSGRLIEAMAARHEGRIETGRPLTALRNVDGQVELRFADGGAVRADRVILSLPPELLNDLDHGGLFSAPWRSFAQDMRLGRNEKLNAAYARRAWASGMGAADSCWNVSAHADVAEVWEESAGQQGEACVLTWFFGGDQTKVMNHPNLRQTVETAMGAAMGDLASAGLDKAHATNWGQEPFTRGAYINFRPGQFTRFGGLTWLEQKDAPTRIARSGAIFFAGEHVSDAWPGYMNGAAQTGRLAAEAICAGR